MIDIRKSIRMITHSYMCAYIYRERERERVDSQLYVFATPKKGKDLPLSRVLSVH